MPISIGRVSSCDTAKPVSRIMSRSSACGISMGASSGTAGRAGKSSAEAPCSVVLEPPALMVARLEALTETVTSPDGSLRTISLSRRALSSTRPSSATIAGTAVSMPICRSVHCRRTPERSAETQTHSSTGWGERVALALEAMESPCMRSSFWQMNFIISSLRFRKNRSVRLF